MDDAITCFYEITELLKLHVDECEFPMSTPRAVLGCADGSKILMGWDDTFAETAHKILDHGGLVSATWEYDGFQRIGRIRRHREVSE